MQNALDNITEISQESTEGTQEGEPPQIPLLSTDEAQFLARAEQILSAQNHQERKRLCDALVPREASARQLAVILTTATGVREKMNGSVNPHVGRILDGVRMRIEKEVEIRIGLNS